jgi:predicted aspartyl protease
MGIYRLSDRAVRRAQASCSPQGRFVVANPLSAKGASSLLAWGNRPRQLVTAAISAEGAFQSASANCNFVSRLNRAFSAGGVLISQIVGRCPTPTMTLCRWRGRLLSEGTGFIFRMVQVCALVLLAVAPLSTFGAAKNRSAMQLVGYKAVPVHYGPMNKMIMSVRINGQPANLLVDTGASQLILDAETAASFGIRPSQYGLRYIRFTQINGQDLPLGFAQNITAGAMNFGSSLVTLRSSSHSISGTGHVDGMLGLDILLRHKAVINCRTKLVFFKVDQGRGINPSAIASSGKFTRVPIQRQQNGALIVPCLIRGQPTCLLVDTGAFVTTFHELFVKSLGIVSEPTRISAQFAGGASKRISAAKINDLNIGGFKAPPEKFGVAPLPQFALQQGTSKIAGILGMDTLYLCHAIIDLGSMSLFLK